MFKDCRGLLLALAFALVCWPGTAAQAGSAGEGECLMDYLEGTWYDAAGQQGATISKNQVNGYEVLDGRAVGGSDNGGGYLDARLAGTQGPANVRIELGYQIGGWHDYLRLRINSSDDADWMLLHRGTPVEAYFESVRGVHLGMTAAQAEALVGKPDWPERGTNYWHYGNAGLDLHYYGGRERGVVDCIRVYGGSGNQFARSGLTADSPLAAFQKAYGLEGLPSQDFHFPTRIGTEAGYEYLLFDEYPQCVILAGYVYDS